MERIISYTKDGRRVTSFNKTKTKNNMKIRQKLLKLLHKCTDEKIDKYVGGFLSHPIMKATGYLLIFNFVYDSLQEKPSFIMSIWMAALIIYLLSKIIGRK